MDERVKKLMTDWETLTVKSSEKSTKLQEANRQRMYTAAVKDLEFWLGEVIVTIACQSVVSLKELMSSWFREQALLGLSCGALC